MKLNFPHFIIDDGKSQLEEKRKTVMHRELIVEYRNMKDKRKF